MNSIERFYATVERRAVDKPASWLGIPNKGALEGLFSYFGVKSISDLKIKLGDDLYPVKLPYHSPVSNDISAAFQFSKQGEEAHRTLTAPGFFEHYADPQKIDDFDWPEPSKYINPAECEHMLEQIPDGYATMGVIWSAHFQDACSAFGMEEALVKMKTEPDIFRVIINRITEFYLEANEIFYSATKGKLHAVLIGNDFGSQTGLMVSPELLREFVFPGTRKLVSQAKSYGLVVVHHSCGAIFDIIPDLIEAGVDVIHPIQALAEGMDPYLLKSEFGDRVSFCGGVDAQNLLVNGKPEQVREKVLELRKLFPTGLVISPSHEAILPDIAPENIEALFEALR